MTTSHAWAQLEVTIYWITGRAFYNRASSQERLQKPWSIELAFSLAMLPIPLVCCWPHYEWQVSCSYHCFCLFKGHPQGHSSYFLGVSVLPYKNAFKEFQRQLGFLQPQHINSYQKEDTACDTKRSYRVAFVPRLPCIFDMCQMATVRRMSLSVFTGPFPHP